MERKPEGRLLILKTDSLGGKSKKSQRPKAKQHWTSEEVRRGYSRNFGGWKWIRWAGVQDKRKIASLPRQVEQECSQGRNSGGRENQDYGYSLQVWGIDSESSKTKQRGDMGVQLMSEWVRREISKQCRETEDTRGENDPEVGLQDRERWHSD